MTALGWLIMFISVGTVTALLAWCIYKVLTIPDETEHVHGFEQETPDTEQND
jgi:putative flippase GtrA